MKIVHNFQTGVLRQNEKRDFFNKEYKDAIPNPHSTKSFLCMREFLICTTKKFSIFMQKNTRRAAVNINEISFFAFYNPREM